MSIIGVTLTHHGMEQLTGWLSSCSSLENLQLKKLSCSDHGSGCILPVLLDLQKCNKLKELRLQDLSVEGLLMPSQIQGNVNTDLLLFGVKMSAQSWRKFIETIKLHVVLSNCNIYRDTRDFISSCSRFSVRRNDEIRVEFNTIN